MRGSIVAVFPLVLSVASAQSLAQSAVPGNPSADPRTRCEQLIAFWLLHGGARGEGSGGADVPRKSAEIDCEAGRYDKGIRTMEDLLRRNGYTVPTFAPAPGK